MVHYFLGARLLGSGKTAWWSDTSIETMSQVFICPTCGEAWGRVVIPDADWTPVRRGCRQHPPINDAGGSFIAPWRHAFAELPIEVLRYEMNIRLEES